MLYCSHGLLVDAVYCLTHQEGDGASSPYSDKCMLISIAFLVLALVFNLTTLMALLKFFYTVFIKNILCFVFQTRTTIQNTMHCQYGHQPRIFLMQNVSQVLSLLVTHQPYWLKQVGFDLVMSPYPHFEVCQNISNKHFCSHDNKYGCCTFIMPIVKVLKLGMQEKLKSS